MKWFKSLQIRHRVSTKIFTALPTARLVHHIMQHCIEVHCISSTVLTEVCNLVFFERQSTAALSHHICVRCMHLSCSPGAQNFSRSHMPAAVTLHHCHSAGSVKPVCCEHRPYHFSRLSVSFRLLLFFSNTPPFIFSLFSFPSFKISPVSPKAQTGLVNQETDPY